ncbi:unnamed protein product [Urochloa decumbens]|uniref:Leucine-rich repeat-containing N-terminal plant-type domain-containing protein n=1 Tax=Urochloa decumbens TaxID=240449 RepID=A0ABC8W9J1_9POAL
MLWVLLVLQFMFPMAPGCVVEERIALMRIRSSLVEANSDVPPSWGRSDDCCSWERVRCNNNTRVSDLNLDVLYIPLSNSATSGCSWNMNFTMFSSFHELQLLDFSLNSACFQSFEGLQELTKLRYLNLSGNYLIGDNILESLDLPSLEVINIELCRMSGALQSSALKNLKNLRELYLGYNQFNGSIPAFLFELPRLEYLDLSGNLLQGLQITSSSNLQSSLRELHLQSNQLNGIIPASLFELPRLEYLDLSENLLQGHTIPISSSSNLSPSLKILDLSANNLKGLFDFFWLRNCTMLQRVDLSGNTDLTIDVKFHGRVPPFQLRELALSGCKLDNSIIAGPNFLGTQSHLQTLDLSNNNLTGSIPSWINTRTLVYLNLANNSLAGSLNLMWQYQSNLEMIDIAMNRLVGQLPTNISLVFPNLTALNASYNIIFGHLPLSLCNISILFVDLSNNKLTGEVSNCLFTDCSSLNVLKLSNNNLGGSILGGASNLSIGTAIYLDSNNFKGALPNNLTGNIQLMDLHDNKLSGKLDVSFWNLPSLQVLNVANNILTGGISPTFCNLTGLQFLDMSDNNFEGPLPNCDSKLTLRFLNMSSNTLSGFLNAFCNSTKVNVLDLRYNQFMGGLDWIHHLSDIRILLLGWNKFGGHISPSFCQLKYLNIIDLSHNGLSGSGFYGIDFYLDHDCPPFSYSIVYDLQGFTFSTKGNLYTYGRSFFTLMSGIDLSANMLSGEIPWKIGNLSHLKSLNLSHNSFTGQIPATFANMSAIESLDLSYNQLRGPIPWQLTQLWSLEVFSVAYNNLSGCIPNSGQFGSFNMESYMGNANLHNLSQGNRCSPIPSPVEGADVGEVSADRSFTLPLLPHSYSHSGQLLRSCSAFHLGSV